MEDKSRASDRSIEYAEPFMRGSIASRLHADKEKIKRKWEDKVRAKVPVADEQTSFALLDSMEIFLDELVLSLKSSTNSRADKAGMSELHGGERAHFAGYFLPQLLKEFSLLREIILEDLEVTGLLNFQAARIINNAIDTSISLAATEFVEVQQEQTTRALEKAKASNKGLEDFAGIAAHDLKSPLATISGYLELLRDENQENLTPSSQSYILIMQNASARMRDLIDRLLDYARLAKFENPYRLVDLNSVMSSVLQNLHQEVQASGAGITFGALPVVRGDVNLLTQLFQNLIANSLKFRGTRTPKIQITTQALPESHLFRLQDNGIGFEAKDREDIFILYKKLGAKVQHEGCGIGLATCKKVVELHGGKIWADSEPGVGSVFSFTLASVEAGPKPQHH